jgi:hypothetical protein
VLLDVLSSVLGEQFGLTMPSTQTNEEALEVNTTV